MKVLTPHTHKVTCSVLANDDSFLVTGSSDSSAKVGGSFKVRYLKVKGKSSGDQSRDWRGASLVHGAHRKRCVAAAHHEQRVSDHGYVFLPFSVAQESLPSRTRHWSLMWPTSGAGRTRLIRPHRINVPSKGACRRRPNWLARVL